MIEKSRRKKHPRAHPHFVWADPAVFHQERMTAGLTQRAAAKYLGVTYRTMRNWETGHTRIPYPAFRLIKMRAGGIVHAEGWDGWRFGRDGALWSPEGRFFHAWELSQLRLVFSMGRYFQQGRVRAGKTPVAEDVPLGVSHA